MAEHYRTIVRDEIFEDELQALIPDVEAVDEFVMAAETLLAREPDIGTRAPNSEVWLLAMPLIGEREVYLYYTFDENFVYFLAFGPAG